MAQLEIDNVFEPNIGPASTPRNPVTVEGSSSANVTATALSGLRDILESGAKQNTRAKSRSLLEEFTGEQAMLDLARKESDILAEEESLVNAVTGSGQGAEDVALTQGHVEILQNQKKELERDRMAVIQGLLSTDEYRKRAETLFYKQVALTPGIRSELAQIMGEHLGIDPRGQTAALTMEAREALGDAEDARRTKMFSQLVKDGFVDENLSMQANIDAFWPEWSKSQQAAFHAENLRERLNTDQLKNETDRKAAEVTARRLLSDAETFAWKGMTQFGEQSLFKMQPQQVLDMDPEVKARWAEAIAAQHAQYTGLVQDLMVSTEGNFQPALDKLNTQRDLLLGILSSEELTEGFQTQLEYLQNMNNFHIEGVKQGILLDYESVSKLAAINDLVQGSGLLETKAEIATIITDALFRGTTPDLTSLETEDRDNVQAVYEKILQNSHTVLGPGAHKLPDKTINDVANVANMVARNPVGSLRNPEVQQVLRIIADPNFMDKLEEVNPTAAQQLRTNGKHHQANMALGYNRFLNQQLRATNNKLNALDFFLIPPTDKTATWIIAPSREALSEAVPGQRGETDADTTRAFKQRRASVIENERSRLMSILNGTPRLFDHMIRARAHIEAVSQQRAAELVAQDLGISLTEDAADSSLTPQQQTVPENKVEDAAP